MKSKYIEDRKACWGKEFADIEGVNHRPEHDNIAAMGCYTTMYYIADNFRDGEFRAEILDLCGVK
jgi:hypothetical protein